MYAHLKYASQKCVSTYSQKRLSTQKFSSKVDFSHTAPLLKRYFTQTKQEHYYEILLAQRDTFVLISGKNYVLLLFLGPGVKIEIGTFRDPLHVIKMRAFL